MPRMQRANSVLHVKDNEVQHYLTLGYNLMSEDGKKIMERAVPKDSAALTAQLLEACHRIEVLERQLQSQSELIIRLSKGSPKAKSKGKAKEAAADEPAE